MLGRSRCTGGQAHGARQRSRLRRRGSARNRSQLPDDGINGGRITVVIHHSGRRVVYGRNADADQASAVELSDHQARKLGAILGGAFFKPAVVEEVEAVFEDLLIDWVALEPN